MGEKKKRKNKQQKSKIKKLKESLEVEDSAEG